MMATDISGTLYWSTSSARVDGAVISAEPEDKSSGLKSVLTNSDDDGDFTLSLDLGAWVISAFHSDGVTVRKDITVVDSTPQSLQMTLAKNNEHDEEYGKKFLRWVTVGFVTALVIYALLHVIFPPAQEAPGNILVSLIDYMRAHLDEDVVEATPGTEATSEPNAASTSETVMGTGERVVARLNALAQNDRLSSEDRADLSSLSQRLETTLSSDNRSNLDGQLVELKLLLNSLAPPGPYFWSDVPARFVEIAFAGLFGILINIIFTAATYMRWRRFYRVGLYLYLSQIVCIPFLVIITTTLLSLANFQLTLANSTVDIDLSNPQTLFVISFLVSLQPWDLWKFVRSTGVSVLNRQVTP